MINQPEYTCLQRPPPFFEALKRHKISAVHHFSKCGTLNSFVLFFSKSLAPPTPRTPLIRHTSQGVTHSHQRTLSTPALDGLLARHNAHARSAARHYCGRRNAPSLAPHADMSLPIYLLTTLGEFKSLLVFFPSNGREEIRIAHCCSICQ